MSDTEGTTIAGLLGQIKPQEARSSRLQDLLEREKAREMEQMGFEVLFGEQPAEVVLTEIRGHAWNDISLTSPRPGNLQDAATGCNTDRLLERYPVDQVTIAGSNPTPEEWLQVVHLIDAPFRADIVSALWWIHVGAPKERLANLMAEKAEKEADHG